MSGSHFAVRAEQYTCNVQSDKHHGAKLCDTSEKDPADALRAHLQLLTQKCLERILSFIPCAKGKAVSGIQSSQVLDLRMRSFAYSRKLTKTKTSGKQIPAAM